MKKRVFTTVALILVLALLSGAYFLLNKGSDNAGETNDYTPDNAIRLLSVNYNSINLFSIKSRDINYTLIKDGGKWSVEGQPEIKLNAEKTEDIIAAASVIDAYGKIESIETELADYGLDEENAALVTLEFSTDGRDEAISFYIGNMTPTEDKYYFRLTDDEAIYTIPAAKGSALLQPLNNLRPKQIHNINTDELNAGTSFEYLEISSQSGAGDLYIRAKTEEEANSDIVSNLYKMEKPYKKDINSSVIEEQIFDVLPDIVISSYIDDSSKDLSIYGLDTANRRLLKFYTKTEGFELYIGNKDNGYMYAQKPDENSVFTISESALAFMDSDPFFLLDTSLYITRIDNVDSIEISGKDMQKYTLKVSPVGDNEYSYSINGNTASENKFKAFYTDYVIGYRISGILQSGANGNVDYTYKITHRDGSPDDEINFVKINERFYSVSVNNSSFYQVETGAVEKMVSSIKEFSENPA